MRIGHGALIIATLAAAVFGPPSALGAAPPPIVQSQPVFQQAQQPQAGAPAAGSPNRFAAAQPQALSQQQDNQALLEMLERLDALQREVQELRGMVEEQTHRSGSLEQRQRELYLDIDRRLRGIEAAGASAPATQGGGGSGGAALSAPSAAPPVIPAPGPTASSPVEQAGVATADPQAERNAYNQAFELVKAGRYDEAIGSLRDFLARYPGSEYSANAQYWLGEANYVSRRFDAAAQEFEKVVSLYPDSGKASDAMLKLGFSFYELQQWGRASEVLKRVVEQYPGSTARQLADGRLQRMRMEGRQ